MPFDLYLRIPAAVGRMGYPQMTGGGQECEPLGDFHSPNDSRQEMIKTQLSPYCGWEVQNVFLSIINRTF